MDHCALRSKILASALLTLNIAQPQIVNKNTPLPGNVETVGLVIPMRDGVHLAADVFRPSLNGRWPTILVRTPYSRKSPNARSFRSFIQRGYAVVVEDVRGRYASQGTFGPITQEGPDAYDTLNWIAEQAWSNGRVAMAGSSYLGIVQWWAAVEDNPHLLAISPVVSGDDEYADRYYSTGGALQLGHRLLWLAENFNPPSSIPLPFDTYIKHLPVRTSDIAATGVPLSLWRSALNHPAYDDFWKAQSLRNKVSRINVPVLSFGGWFDNYAESDLDAFARLAKQHKPVETWIGPWAHNPGLKFPTEDFGPDARISIRAKQLDWFDRWVKKSASADARSTEHDLPSLHLFVMGPNVWREEHEWPLAHTHYTPLYLSSQGHANTSSGDGILQWQITRKSPVDNFTYDPKNPVPTMGGSVCCEPKVLPPGPLDQMPVEGRSDVLVYTSSPLAEDLEVTGPIRTVLYVSTSVNDTDFTSKLVDVYPSGRPLMVTDGIQRLRYRLSLDKPVFVKRNQAYQISVDVGVTSYVFGVGHRIRLEVSSSNFPRFDRNLNNPMLNVDQIKALKAKQTIFHQKGYPSAVILPIIGRVENLRALR